jgi:hypothetical protein
MSKGCVVVATIQMTDHLHGITTNVATNFSSFDLKGCDSANNDNCLHHGLCWIQTIGDQTSVAARHVRVF